MYCVNAIFGSTVNGIFSLETPFYNRRPAMQIKEGNIPRLVLIFSTTTVKSPCKDAEYTMELLRLSAYQSLQWTIFLWKSESLYNGAS